MTPQNLVSHTGIVRFCTHLKVNFYTLENINIGRGPIGNFFNNEPKILKLIVRDRNYHILIYI